jgi:hypothetical protein
MRTYDCFTRRGRAVAELQPELRGAKYAFNIVEGVNQWYYVKSIPNSVQYYSLGSKI